MHGGADGVAGVLPHDAVAGGLGHLLHGVADVGQPVAVDHLVDAGEEALVGHLDQTGGLLGDLADGRGEGGVAVVALDDRPAVDRDDVALLQRRVVGDAVDDHVVGRRADDGRERRGAGAAAVVQEVGPGAAALDDLAADPVELAGGDPGADGLADLLVHLGHDLAGAAHLRQLLGRPAHRQAPAGSARAASMTLTRRSKTSSSVPTPSTSTSRSRSPNQFSSGRGLLLVEPTGAGRWPRRVVLAAAGDHPLGHHVDGDVEVDGQVDEGLAQVAAHGLDLAERAGVAVEQPARRGVGLGQALRRRCPP